MVSNMPTGLIRQKLLVLSNNMWKYPGEQFYKLLMDGNTEQRSEIKKKETVIIIYI